jgi:hypothetical protein
MRLCFGQWADAHLELLQDFIRRKQADKEKYGTEIYVAGKELESWEAFKSGRVDDVDQNFYYVHYDAGLFKKCFGIDP